MDTTFTPFDRLISLEKKAQALLRPITEKKAPEDSWSGLGFLLNQHHFIVESGTVSEVLTMPGITPLPDVQQWVRGIANIRGKLASVIDLSIFFGFKNPIPESKQKILLIEKEGMSIGLTVDQVQGIFQFNPEQNRDEIPESLALSIRPFITGCYYKSKYHMIFNTQLLMKNRRFLKATKYS